MKRKRQQKILEIIATQGKFKKQPMSKIAGFFNEFKTPEDKIAFYKPSKTTNPDCIIPFSLGQHILANNKIIIEKVTNLTDKCQLKDGFYGDLDKILDGSVIRFKLDGDKLTKFGGGTKSLNDFLTDKKIPLRVRKNLPILAHKNEVLCIFGVAISEKIRIDDNTKNIIKFTISHL